MGGSVSNGKGGRFSCVTKIPSKNFCTSLNLHSPEHPSANAIGPLSQVGLNSVDWRVDQAARTLGKTVSNPITKNLLKRNAVIVEEASQLLAFGWIDDNNNHVVGGTGWAVELAKLRGIPTFLYELKYEEWWQWQHDKQRWFQCEGMTEDIYEPPVLPANTVHVRTREPPPTAQGELHGIFDRYEHSSVQF